MWIPVVVVLLSIPVADGVYRWAGARPSDDLAGLYTAFGDGSYRHRADVHTSTEWFSGPFTVLTDDLGLRCGSAETSRTEAGDHVDVLVLGDSQGYGQCLDFEESVVGQLAALAEGEGEHVANVSVGGHFLRNQLENARWLHDEKRLEIDRVVVLLTPYMILTAGEYNRARVGADGKLYGGEPNLAVRLAMWAKTNTALYGRVRNAVRNVMGVEQDDSMLFRFFDTGEKGGQRLEKLRAVLGELRDWTDSIGAELTLVYTPLAVEMDFESVALLAREGGREIDRAVPFEQASRAAEELGIPLIDLRSALAEIQAEGKPLSCRGDPHYNPETSRACARRIWASLQLATTQ